MDKILYFVTTTGKKDTRCVGFYEELEVARSVVIKHSECLAEAGYYQYAVIEGFSQGWYPDPKVEEWYEFIDYDKAAKKIDKPEQYKQVLNFGIG